MGIFSWLKSKPPTAEEINKAVKDADNHLAALKHNIDELAKAKEEFLFKRDKVKYSKVIKAINLIDKYIESIQELYSLIKRDKKNPKAIEWKKKILKLWHHLDKLAQEVYRAGKTFGGIEETELAKKIEKLDEEVMSELRKERIAKKKLTRKL